MDVPSDWKSYVWYVVPGAIFLFAWLKVDSFKFGGLAFIALAFIIGFIFHSLFRFLSNDCVLRRGTFHKSKDAEVANARYIANNFSKNSALVEYIRMKSIMLSALGTCSLSALTGFFILRGDDLFSTIYLLMFLIFAGNLNVVWNSMIKYESVLKTL